MTNVLVSQLVQDRKEVHHGSPRAKLDFSSIQQKRGEPSTRMESCSPCQLSWSPWSFAPLPFGVQMGAGGHCGSARPALCAVELVRNCSQYVFFDTTQVYHNACEILCLWRYCLRCKIRNASTSSVELCFELLFCFNSCHPHLKRQLWSYRTILATSLFNESLLVAALERRRTFGPVIEIIER